MDSSRSWWVKLRIRAELKCFKMVASPTSGLWPLDNEEVVISAYEAIPSLTWWRQTLLQAQLRLSLSSGSSLAIRTATSLSLSDSPVVTQEKSSPSTRQRVFQETSSWSNWRMRLSASGKSDSDWAYPQRGSLFVATELATLSCIHSSKVRLIRGFTLSPRSIQKIF